MLIVAGELLDGFHLETIPQLSSNQFDMNALSAIAGMRAVWLLYLRGRWDLLEDLGIDRARLEPALKRFNYDDPLTIRQAQQLYKKVPELVEASRELRLAYALKQYDNKEKKNVRDHLSRRDRHAPAGRRRQRSA